MLTKVRALLVVAALCLPAAAQGLASIDFGNFEYPWPPRPTEPPATWRWLEEIPGSSVRPKDGLHTFEPNIFSRSDTLHLESVIREDLDGDGHPEAVVELFYNPDGTANWYYLYVFRFADGQPELVGILESGERSQGGLFRVQVQDGLLVLDFLDPERARGLCCSDGTIRVRYRLDGNRFNETGEREKDSLRVAYQLPAKTGPETVRNKLMGHQYDVVYTDANGVDRILSSSSSWRSEPDLSSDKSSVVFLREVDQERQEIWAVRTDGSGERLLHRGPVTWNRASCPSSSIRDTKWSIDGRFIYFVTDCTATTGALWRLEVRTGNVAAFIPDAALYGVIQTGRFKGFLIANQRTLPSADDPSGPRYPVYLFYLFSPEGERLSQVAEEWDSVELVLPRWEGR